ncbi:SDR family oxidoreductase [Bacillus sp. FJAT-44742]|uniref:SDR family oxidoreductase n=1 Tax=Bacillus sp. FJAT-44742 TaxID=2014005 RepID=UPI000C244810|nr:SDR family oxidoreductase [Bacillus sp. FJAT-44742]
MNDQNHVFITGGNKGLGRHIALKFAREGSHVFINYNSDDEKARETKEMIEEEGGNITLLKADIGNTKQLKEMLGRLPAIDIFIHNAVYAKTAKVESIEDNDWEKSMAVNVTPLVKISRHLFYSMKEKQFGRIFAISSIGSTRAIPGYMNVGVAKAAEEAVIRYMAAEWGPYGITANVVSPGAMDTEAFRAVFQDKADLRLEQAAKRTPAKRIISFDEVADVIYHYSHPAFSMATGQNIRMDGGAHLLS